MKKKVLSFILCMTMVITGFCGSLVKSAQAVSIDDTNTNVISKDITQTYPGDFGTQENQESNRITFSLSTDLKAGQYINFTMNATMPVEQFGIMYDCQDLGGMKFGCWTGANAGTFRFSIRVPYDTNWFDLILYTNIGVPKGTEITVSNITASDACGDFSGTGTGYLGVGENVVPLSAKKGDVVIFDVDIINGSIPNKGGMATCLWVWQNTNSDISKLLHGNIYTTPEGQQRAEVCLTEDINSFYVTIDVQNVPSGALTTVIISNVHSGDWHDDGRMVNFDLKPHEKCVIDGNNYYYTVAAGTNITALAPTFAIASDASIDKESGSVQDFTNPVTYTVTSRMGYLSTYTVTVYALDRISDVDNAVVQEITDRANALPSKITAADSQIIAEATQLKEDVEALTILQSMLLDDAVRAKILQAAQQAADVSQPIRITCVGDSITQGIGSEDESTQSYPAQLQAILGDGYQVFNAGVSGAQVRVDSELPYMGTSRYEESIAFAPNIVIIMLGTNDAAKDRCTTPEKLAEFEQDYKALVDSYRALETSPKIYIALPTYCYGSSGDILSNLKAYINPLIAVFAENNDLELIDMNAFTAGHVDWFPDTLHPSADAYAEIAEEFSKYVLAFGEAKLASLSVNGTAITSFEGDKFTYAIGVPQGAAVPSVAASATQMDAEISVEAADSVLPTSVTVTVTSGDGHARNVYTINVSEMPLESIKQRIDAEIAELTPSNMTTADDIMAIINRFVGSSGVTAVWTESFTKEAAKPGVPGKIAGQVSLSNTGEADQTVTFDLTIPALQGEQGNAGENGENQSGDASTTGSVPTGDTMESGDASTTGSVPTGDTMEIGKCFATMAISCAGIISVAYFKRREKDNARP